MDSSSAKSKDERRTLRGFFVRPGSQFKLALALVIFISLLQIVSTMVIGLLAHRMFLTVVANYSIDPEVGRILAAPLFAIVLFTGILSVFSAVIMIFVWLRLNQKVFGPLVPLLRHIQALKEGKFEARVKLRKNDELTEVRDALNDLAASLEAKPPEESL